MSPIRPHVFRHAVRALSVLGGAVLVLASPPALSGGLPGPGLWPCIVGSGLLFCALVLPEGSTPSEPLSREQRRRAGGLLVPCLLWTALLPLAGWLAATFFAGVLACRNGGCSRTESLLLPSVLCLALWLASSMVSA